MTGTSAQDHHGPRRRRRIVRARRIAAGAAVALAGVAVLGPLGSSADPPDTDPTTAPVPEIEPETDEKSLVATVAFDDRTVATPVSAEVRFGPAHSHIGDAAGAEAVGRRARVDAGMPERLGGVDVPDTGDEALVEQHGLDGAAAPGERASKHGRRERGVVGLGPECRRGLDGAAASRRR